MLAMRLERNVLQQDDLVITAHFLEYARKVARRVVGIARAIFPPRPRNAVRRVDQPSRKGSSPAQRISVRTASATSSGTSSLPSGPRRSPGMLSLTSFSLINHTAFAKT